MEGNDIITCEVASSVRTKTIFVKLSPQSTVRDLLDKIADRYSKPRDFFSLYFVVNLSEPNESDDDNICLDDMENQKLEALLPDHKQECAKFLIKWHHTDSNALANKTENMEQLLLSQGNPLPEIISPLELPTGRESSNNRLGMVGLVNQAMTCYLNSLLQSLFMTPEFRNAIYRWKFSGSQAEGWKSIPFQLQRLFLQLQNSKKKAIPTTNITQSFGWDTSDAWQQHDVQELCRVMFDALEKTWKDTDQWNLINELYQGKMRDFIQCSECGWQSTKYVAYQDIPLVVKPFGSDKAYASVEESLDGFCAPELLDGNNQWFCEHCQKKVDAKKCLKFVTFPYILTFHFMRFGFDYTTMRRIKLNNRVTFPEVLNLDRYISESEGGQDVGACDNKGEDASKENTGSGGDFSLEQQNYELFSIMIHSGNANGGHYYAYIKSFDAGQWYNFDDQSVTKISHDEIYKTFGGSSSPSTYYLPMFASSTNAYMVMYRKIDKKQNAGFMKIEEFPSYLKEVLMNIEEEEEQVRKKQEIERSCCKIKIFMFHPINKKLLESLLVVNINKTLKEATDLSWELFELEGVVNRDCVRLVQYDSEQDYIEQSFHSFDENVVSVYELLGGPKSWYSFDLLLETKSPTEEFQSYQVGEWLLRVHPVDLEREEILPDLSIRVNPRATVLETGRLIMAKFHSLKYLDPLLQDDIGNSVNNEPVLPQQLNKENHNSPFEESECFDTDESEFHSDVCQATPRFPPNKKEDQVLSKWQILLHVKNEFVRLQNFHKQIKNEGFSKISDLYVQCVRTDADSKKAATTSSFHNFLKKHHNQITVKVSFEKCLNWNGGNLSKQLECNGKEPKHSPEINKLDEEIYPSMDGNTLDHDFICQPSTEMKSDDLRSTNEQDRKESFKVEFLTSQPCSGITECLVTFDKRIRVRTFKEFMRPHVGIQEFDLHKVLVGMCPDERLMRSIENFTLFENNSQIRIKAGRDLKKNEFLLKVYQLDICKVEVINFLFEFILTKGITVAEVKSLIANLLQERDNIDISPNHIRIRKKIWKNPTAVLDDTQKFDDVELFVTYNSEIFVQFLTEPDPQGNDKRYIFVRRWWPSKYQLDPVKEIITKRSIIDFIHKISEISDIDAENIQISKVSGMFPNETPLLDIHTGLVWLPYQNNEVNLPETALESLDIYSDGTMFYYRDKTENLKHLTQEEKNGILQKCKIFPSVIRKEKALKIYMESAVNTQVNSNAS